ncbi:MAG: hypothetical protein J07HN4v3_01833 [Halonotius sp. J07HN4]|nr:MAG: hypothetical protein J07HN4v3_01833 [Halonotius sp. J07HN4]
MPCLITITDLNGLDVLTNFVPSVRFKQRNEVLISLLEFTKPYVERISTVKQPDR